MAASSKFMIGEAEKRFPVRLTPAGLRGVVNDAVGIYFLDPASAAGFVARWCATTKGEIAGGAFQIRDDEPTKRVPLKDHKTP